MSLTWRERKALSNLDIVQWENAAQLYVGSGTIESLLARGLIQHHVTTPTGQVRYSITDAGRAALKAPRVVGPKARHPRLVSLKPRLGALDTRSVHPAKR